MVLSSIILLNILISKMNIKMFFFEEKMWNYDFYEVSTILILGCHGRKNITLVLNNIFSRLLIVKLLI